MAVYCGSCHRELGVTVENLVMKNGELVDYEIKVKHEQPVSDDCARALSGLAEDAIDLAEVRRQIRRQSTH
jgi:hypothetical protein